jgi:hypothetical protein
MANFPGEADAFARAWDAVRAFIHGRLAQLRILLVQAGIWEDRVLNVIDLGGDANMTVSTHTALAAGYRPHDVRLPLPERKWWGCVGCRMLSFLVQNAHCWKVMNHVPMTAQNYLRASLCISWVLLGPFCFHWWAFAVDGVVILPFAVREQISRWSPKRAPDQRAQ